MNSCPVKLKSHVSRKKLSIRTDMILYQYMNILEYKNFTVNTIFDFKAYAISVTATTRNSSLELPRYRAKP